MEADEVTKVEGGVASQEVEAEHGDFDCMIDMVAIANDAQGSPAHLPPVLRASPCAMHARQRRHDLDLLYSTSCHGGKVKVKLTGDAGRGHDRGEGGTKGPAGRTLSPLMSHGGDYSPRHQPMRTGRGDYDSGGGGGGGGGGGEGLGGGGLTLHELHKSGVKPIPHLGTTNPASHFSHQHATKDTKLAKVGLWDGACSPRALQQQQHQPNHNKLYQQQQQPHNLYQQQQQQPNKFYQQQLQQLQQRRLVPGGKLPGDLPTQDVVLSWLKHGSAPANESHFPELTPRGGAHRAADNGPAAKHDSAISE